MLSSVAQAFINLIAGEIDIDMIVEDGRHLREAIARKGARVLKPGDSGKRGFDGKGHLPFDLLGREGRYKRVDLNLIVRDIGDGVDWKLLERPDADGGGR